ncbi:transposase [Aureliella helgolandensis]|uniref:transposase n=1 Tax=Aureliella helgolandensis TaxID=2527968 RepID=UPI0018D15393
MRTTDFALARLSFTHRCRTIRSTRGDIAALFRRRWQAELHLRSLKTVMQMEHLRCKKPHRVRNEIRTHMLAYNLIRGVMSEAAVEGDVQWHISSSQH